MSRFTMSYVRSPNWAYVLAVLLSLGAMVLTFWLWPTPTTIMDEPPPLVLSGLAALAAAWFLGQGPGLLVTFLTAATHAWACYPAHSVLVTRPSDVMRIVVYIFTWVVFSLMSGARRRAEASLRFLSQASGSLAGSLDYPTVLERSAALAVPELADFCVVYTMAANGQAERVAAAHADPAQADLGKQFCALPPDLQRDQALAMVFKTGFMDVNNALPRSYQEATCASPEEVRVKEALGARARLLVPLSVRGRILGVLSLTRTGRRPFRSHDIELAEQLALRVAVALDNARLLIDARQGVKMAFNEVAFRF